MAEGEELDPRRAVRYRGARVLELFRCWGVWAAPSAEGSTARARWEGRGDST
jgi:hypothetical protein